MKLRPITIIGGGLAGLTLGVGLRQRDVPVTVFEKGAYPRHRVCGEFISGRGQAVLETLGLRSQLLSAGAALASKAVFILAKTATHRLRIEPPAICLSRYRLDALLAQVFEHLGGTLLQNTSFRTDLIAEGTVRASGRRPCSNRKGWRWFGLKIHAKNLELSADLEMHCLRNGYVGLTRIEEGKVNVCGLFRRHCSEPAPSSVPSQLLLGPPGSVLRERLQHADFDVQSDCAVAGLGLEPRWASASPECRVGDALTMIPPVTGNGMSMAIEAAAAALNPLQDYSEQRLSWDQAQRQVAEACDRMFAPRLKLASRLQRLLFIPWAQNRAGALLLNSPSLWRLMFAGTR